MRTINRFKLPSGVFATDRSKAVPHCVPLFVRFVLVCWLCVCARVCVCVCVFVVCTSACCRFRFGEAAILVRGIPRLIFVFVFFKYAFTIFYKFMFTLGLS